MVFGYEFPIADSCGFTFAVSPEERLVGLSLFWFALQDREKGAAFDRQGLLLDSVGSGGFDESRHHIDDVADFAGEAA